ncbi:PREDICTED: uncharacterized protein LOC107162670 [Diuraphis noxia]|uniref:uncharacterized protein LOC107162670 n=1 Tax=Diuraphis noxia TaxID=143948 RepID=UPI000763971E|nr:PREDICTED: uncharacterized protein LOC107162670 [Diuraphis noxia]
MAAEWPTLAVVFLLACLLLPIGGDGVRPRDDDGQQQPSWCQKEECKCEQDDENRLTVKCAFSGEKDVIWEPVKNLNKSLVVLEFNGDGRCNLTINHRVLAAFAGLRSFNVTGFDLVTIRSQGMLAKYARTNFTVNISHVRQLYLDTNAFHPYDGTAEVLLEDCDVVRLGSEVVFKLRSFVFRRIRVLELSKNTFKNAATGSSIEKMILEDLNSEKLPSYAFCTSIDMLSITNCTFGTIERRAFPINDIGNATLTNVTVDHLESEAFQSSTLISNLRMYRCVIQEMQSDSIMSVVQSIIIEQSKFGSVQTSAVAVATQLELYGNSFTRVASRGFVLHNFHVLLVHGNTFEEIEAEAFYETIASSPETRSTTQATLRVCDNSFLQSSANGKWSPPIRLQRAASETNITGNMFVGPCGCGPWQFVAVANSTAADDNDDDGDDYGDTEFTDLNYCRVNVVGAECANLTAVDVDRMRISEFAVAAGCDQDDGSTFNWCVRNRLAAVKTVGTGRFPPIDFLSPTAERGVITTVVLLVLCGFGAVCAVSAVTWLNARGYFIKLRSLLTPNSHGSGGGAGTACRTISAHSLSRMSVHEYAELQRLKLGGGSCGSDVGAVRVIVYQDKGTQTVPEELTHEMLQNLRDKLDDPNDYAEARGIIEHLYDLIRVEETCCGDSGVGGWYSPVGERLDDMTSTVMTKAVTADDGLPRDVKSVGTGAPSLDRLRTPRINMAGAAGQHARRPQPPPSPSPSVNSDYVDPVDLLYGGVGNVRDDESYTDIYCELTDLRSTAEERPPPPEPPQQPPPVPDKPIPV